MPPKRVKGRPRGASLTAARAKKLAEARWKGAQAGKSTAQEPTRPPGGPPAPLPSVFDTLDLFPEFAEPSWAAWRVFLKATEGQALEPAELEIFARHTGRTRPPTKPVREAYVVAGRRGGKSQIASVIAIDRARRERTWKLATGERVAVPVISADREQAAIMLSYVKGMLAESPALAGLVVGKPTKTGVALSNRTRIEIYTSSYRTVRGRTLAAAFGDELAFWRNEETSTNPDREIITALKPGLLTSRGPLICISSPYARKGVLWEMYKRYFGVEDAPVLIWQASSLEMNPTLDPDDIARAFEEDPEAASAEYGGLFRSDLETFISEEMLSRVVASGRLEVEPVGGITYVAFVDPSGGSQDSFTLCIAHRDVLRNVIIVDFVREIRAPFSPEVAVEALCQDLKRYRVARVVGDHYAGEWPVEQFRKRGVTYYTSEENKSELYLAALPIMTSQRVELLDHARMLGQFRALERRTGRTGHDVVDHPPKGKDDLCNAVAGALVQVKLSDQHFILDVVSQTTSYTPRSSAPTKGSIEVGTFVKTPGGLEFYRDPRGDEPREAVATVEHDVDSVEHRVECRACRRRWRTS